MHTRPIDEPTTALLDFGRWTVLPAQRLLCLDGVPVPLGGRAFDLLLALAEQHDRVVSKAELMDRVWPEIDVEENNLAVQVLTLRKLMGPAAVATVPGRGYRLALAPAAPPVPLPASPERPDAARAPATGFQPLPLRPGALLGRDDDLAALQQLQAGRRLVTLLGPGGMGKSSLALAAAHASRALHPNAVAWVELAAVADAAGVVAAVCSALRIPPPTSADALPALVEALRPLSLLLVIDNAEHLVDAVARLASQLLAAAPRVRLLITSQAALRIDGEQLMRLGPLALAPLQAGVDEALACGAVALFVDQARYAERRFALTADNLAAVSALCLQLEGLPLALKLAAARLPLLGLAGLRAGLANRLALLAGGSRLAPDRQQTLAAALAWSCSLLDADERAMFCRLGVFVQGFSLALAVGLCADLQPDEAAAIELLGSLVDRSLVELMPGGDGDSGDADEAPRYRLLQSTRAYALQQLGDGRAEAEHRHAAVMLHWMRGEQLAAWARSDAASLARCAPELDNLRAALTPLATSADATALALWAASAWLFLLLGLDHEARQRCSAPPVTAPDSGDAVADADTAAYWWACGRLHWNRDNSLANEQAAQATAIYRRLGAPRGLYAALCLAAAAGQGDAAQESALLLEAAALEQPDWPPRLRHERAWAQIYLSKRADQREQALAAADAAGALALAAGAAGLYWTSRSAVVSCKLALARVDEAAAVAEEALRHQPARHGRAYITSLGSLYAARLMQGRPAEARPLLQRFLDESRRCDWEVLPRAADWCALLAALEGRFEAAARLLGHADAATTRRGGREHHERLAHARALAPLLQALPAADLQAWREAGATLDAEGVYALTLATA